MASRSHVWENLTNTTTTYVVVGTRSTYEIRQRIMDKRQIIVEFDITETNRWITGDADREDQAIHMESDMTIATNSTFLARNIDQKLYGYGLKELRDTKFANIFITNKRLSTACCGYDALCVFPRRFSISFY